MKIYQMPDSTCNHNISGLFFGNTSKILGEVTMVKNGGAHVHKLGQAFDIFL
jgi:hypothetical protein